MFRRIFMGILTFVAFSGSVYSFMDPVPHRLPVPAIMIFVFLVMAALAAVMWPHRRDDWSL